MFIEMRSIHYNELQNTKTVSQHCFKTSYNEEALKEATRIASSIQLPCIAIVHDKNIDYVLGTEAGIFLFNTTVHPIVI